MEHGLASIAYPAISTGAYGFPPDRAALIALRTVHAALEDNAAIERVVFCCFGAKSRERHETALAAVTQRAYSPPRDALRALRRDTQGLI